MKITLDVNALTFGDMEDFESATGEELLAAVTAMTEGCASAKALTGLIWVCQRASDPTFTLEQARSVRVSDLDVEVVGEPDPTDGRD